MKKIVCMLLSVAMLSAFVGCNENDKTKTESGVKTAAYVASSQETINFGVIAPISGKYSLVGAQMKNGIDTAVEELNAAGGLLGGKKISIKYADDKSEDSTLAYDSLKNTVSAVIGPYKCSEASKVAALAEADFMLMVMPNSVTENITYNRYNCFRSCYTSIAEGTNLAKYIYAEKKIAANKIAVLYNDTELHSTTMHDELINAIEADKGISLEVVYEGYYTNSTTDFADKVSEIISKSPDCVFVPDYYDNAYQIVKQLRASGYNGAIVGSDAWDGIEDYATDKTILNNCHYPTFYSANDKGATMKAKGFAEKYEKNFSKKPGGIAAQCYDTVMMLANAIKKCESAEINDIMAALTEMEFSGICGDLKLDGNGNAAKPTAFVECKDGSAHLIALINYINNKAN
ncbi:MAG: ABC transporter substrate-binding protein [Oscillospiraceae bacterium]